MPNFTNGTHGDQKCGTGGFFPFGVTGMIAGAAKCFYAFVGKLRQMFYQIDLGFGLISNCPFRKVSIASQPQVLKFIQTFQIGYLKFFSNFRIRMTTGEEVKNPQKAIPISIIGALVVCCISYCGVSAILSLMLPYYLIDQNAPMPEAFRYAHWDWARYIVAVGAICSLSTRFEMSTAQTATTMFDLIVFYLKFVGRHVSSTPCSVCHIVRWAYISLFGSNPPKAQDAFDQYHSERFFRRYEPVQLVTMIVIFKCFMIRLGFMAMIFDLDQLVNMMSIGTLMAYSLVALSVLVLRFVLVYQACYYALCSIFLYIQDMKHARIAISTQTTKTSLMRHSIDMVHTVSFRDSSDQM
jgi:amino acid transporter